MSQPDQISQDSARHEAEAAPEADRAADHPTMRVLDALFAQIQLEQKLLTRRYMAVTAVRGVAQRLMADGLPVDLGMTGDVLTLAVPVRGLAAFAEVLPGPAPAAPAPASAVPVRATSPKVVRPKPLASAPRVSKGSKVWTPAEDARLIGLIVKAMCAGEVKMHAIKAAAWALGRSPKACESRLFNHLSQDLDSALKAVPEGEVARAATLRKAGGGPFRGWSADEQARLVQLVADGLGRGLSKGDAVTEAAKALGRPREGVWFRVLCKAKDDLAAELARRSVADVSEQKSSPAEAVAAACKDVLQVAAPAVEPEPVQPVVKESLTLAAPMPLPPRPEGRETQVAAPVDLDPVTAHLREVTKGDAALMKRDFAIIHLACANWSMPEIATDLGMDSKAVKQRFEVLCGYDPATKKGRFPRSYVYHGLEALLKLKAVA